MGLPTTYKYQCDCGYGSDNPDDFARCEECRYRQGADAPKLCRDLCLGEYAGQPLCRRHFNQQTNSEGTAFSAAHHPADVEIRHLRAQIKRTRECLRRGLARANVETARNRPDGSISYATVAGRLEGAILSALGTSGGLEPADEHLVTPLAKEKEDGRDRASISNSP